MQRTRNEEDRARHAAELNGPPFPLATLHIWNAFQRLHGRRGSNGFAINPISWPDIDAFLRHAQLALAPWEISLIEQLDDLYRMAQADPKDVDS